MNQERRKNVNSATAAETFVGPGRKVTQNVEEFPKIKEELSEMPCFPTSAYNAEEELDDEEDDDYVVDEDGIEYYEDEAFRIKQVSKPLIVNRTMRDLYSECNDPLFNCYFTDKSTDLSKGKYLKLDPEYQRDVVWDESRASQLIASLIRKFVKLHMKTARNFLTWNGTEGYFIPPIIFNLITEMEEPDDGGPKKPKFYRICVDGKQRLTSLIKFMNGKIGVSDNSKPPKKWL
jgi:hypothetical protein